MNLSNKQIQELLDVIKQQNLQFIGVEIGSSVLSLDDKEFLKLKGIDITLFPQEGSIDEAFRFGILSQALGDDRSKKMDYKEFKKFLKSGKFLELTETEKFALDTLKSQAYTDLSGLGSRIISDVSDISVQNNKKQFSEYKKHITETAEQTAKDRESIHFFATELGKKTGDWTRDLDRVADYIHHDAFDQGRALQILKEYGQDAKVYKDVYEGACKYCIRLYLTGELGSVPRIFNLKDLMANGSNIGRKAAEYLPVVGATHPWCRCTINLYNNKYIWSEKTRAFTTPVKQIRTIQRPEIKITVNGLSV